MNGLSMGLPQTEADPRPSAVAPPPDTSLGDAPPPPENAVLAIACGGFLEWNDRAGGEPGKVRETAPFSEQTLANADIGDGTAVFVLHTDPQTTNAERPIPANLLEIMCWALLSRPSCDIILQPLRTAIISDFNGVEENLTLPNVSEISKGGFIGMMRKRTAQEWMTETDSCRIPALAIAGGATVMALRRPLFSEKFRTRVVKAPTSRIHRLKQNMRRQMESRLPADVYVTLRRIGRGAKLISGRNSSEGDAGNAPRDLHRAKRWEPVLPWGRVKVKPPAIGSRIPVLFALHWLELGGAERFALDLIRRLPKDRYAIFVTTDVSSSNDWAEALTGHVEDVIHLPEFLQPDARAAFYAALIRTRGIELLHIHHAPAAYASLFYLRRWFPDLKIVDTLHILEADPYSGGYPELVAKDYEPLIDHHHVTSGHLQRFLSERWRIPDRKISLIYTNVDCEYYDPDRTAGNAMRSQLGIPEDACVVGFVGRLHAQKRPDEFVRMAEIVIDRAERASLPEDIYFAMVGNGVLMEQVKELSRRSALKGRLLISSETLDVRHVYRDIDILAMPSRNEGLALVTFEAMAMEVPVIFTDVGAQSELLSEEFLVPADSPVAEKLAERVWALLGDPERRKAIGRRSRRYVVEKHGAAEMAGEMQAVYERLLCRAG